MRRSCLVAVALLVLASLSVAAAKPLHTAHGQLWATLQQPNGIIRVVQVVFNVQDRGDQGFHGTASVRFFVDQDKSLGGVLQSLYISDLQFTPDGDLFFTVWVRWVGPGNPIWPLAVWAKDGGEEDQFGMLSPGHVVLDLTGKIVVR